MANAYDKETLVESLSKSKLEKKKHRLKQTNNAKPSNTGKIFIEH